MTLSINRVLGLLAGILLPTFSPTSWATVTFTLATGIQTVTVPLSPPVISAGVDAPVGTVLYRAMLRMKDGYADVKWPASDVGKYLYTSISANLKTTPQPLANLPVGPYADGVYQTGIPGIGVAIFLSDTSTNPVTTAPRRGENQTLLDSSLGVRDMLIGTDKNFAVALIKTGPLTPGNYSISGANFPTMQYGLDYSGISQPNAAAISGLPIYYWNVSFQGNITVSAQTCTTPDVSVNLGTYEIGEHFRALNSTTPWKDASIALTNCPKFYGFYNLSNAPLLMDYNTGKSTSTTSLNNTIGVRLAPANGVIDAANGVMAIDATVSGAASGVGIQLGWGLSSQTPTPFNFSTEQAMTLPKDGSTTIQVPLAARYIQTAAKPTPGRANGKVTFTINYY
ncbi:type 1 fimbria pilin [Serratia fonticola]|uniref:Type 1 fimbria pilin n=1 Tax=Serratia fonticola TaxID=47917 RepID=A0A559T1Q8_SERFO|nr:fimbrial protein [Serratia fonticola]TQI78966.1 type 1 fimbria pilin [Serratia fonticola]TQI99012.1 type 1 fimbria pilin [Serratia fonticola]TVZ68537.1 type 1 fimbria pilin [Serratia fonticola]